MNPLTAGSRRLALRAALGAVLGAAAVVHLAAPSDAAAPTRIDAEYWGVSCVTSLPGGDTLFLYGGGTTDGAEGGVGGFVEDAQGGMVAEGQADEFSFGSTFTAGIDLGRRFTVSATTSPGEKVTEVIDERDGNRWTKGTAEHTEVALTVTAATWDGAPVAVDPGACSGGIDAFQVRSTNPNTQIHRDSSFASDICDVEGLPDGQVLVGGALPDADVQLVLDHGGEDVEKAHDVVRLRGGRGSVTTDVRDVFTGEVRTRATIGLELAPSGKTRHVTQAADGIVERRSITPYRESITVSFADGRRGTATCSGIAVTTRTQIR